MSLRFSSLQPCSWLLVALLALAGCQTDGAARADHQSTTPNATVIEGTTADGEAPRPEVGVSTEDGALRLELTGLRAANEDLVSVKNGPDRLVFESEEDVERYDGLVVAHGKAPGYVVFRQRSSHVVEGHIHSPSATTSDLEEESSTLTWTITPDSETTGDRAELTPSTERGVLEPMWADGVPGLGDDPLTIVVRRVKLEDVLELFSAKYGIPIFAGVATSELVTQRVSLDLHEVSFERAFRIFLDAHDLGYFGGGERLRIVQREQIQHEREMLAHIPILAGALERSPTNEKWDAEWETSRLWIDDFIQTGPAFFVWGKAFSSGDIAEFLRRLESLDSVMLTGLEKVTNVTEEGASPTVLKFKILGRFHLKPPAGTDENSP